MEPALCSLEAMNFPAATRACGSQNGCRGEMKLLALKKKRRKVQRAFWALIFHKLIGPIVAAGKSDVAPSVSRLQGEIPSFPSAD